jgi:hypothetical protein
MKVKVSGIRAERGMVTRVKKRKRKMTWQKSLDKGLGQVIKRQQKITAAKQKIHFKAAKARQKKLEKSIDKVVFAVCAVICLIAAWIEIKENQKVKKSF